MRPVILYRAGALTPILALSGDGRLEAALGRMMVGWELTPTTPGATADGPMLIVEQQPDGWRCSGCGFDEPVTYPDPVAAGCGVVAGLFKAHTFADLDGLCLHAAGVRFGDGVVLLTGDYRAGKSLLAAACCAAGQQVFSDDIIPLVPGQSVAKAPGLALRLRMPLPVGLDAASLEFVARHGILEGVRYLYVRPADPLIAAHGVEAPVRAMVTIERRDDGPAFMVRSSAEDALADLIRRNFARSLPARRILDALDRLVARVPCLRLVYADAWQAAAMMQRLFAGSVEFDGPVGKPPERAGPAAGAADSRAAIVDADALICRGSGVGMHQRGEQIFLTDSGEQAIYNLNPTGAAVWRLIEEPRRFGDLVALFGTAFPDRPPERLAADLARLARELEAGGLVHIAACGAAGCTGADPRPKA